MLKRVFYVSEIASQTTPLDVRAIVSSSIVWNRRHDITGLLVMSVRNFAQVLEGRDDQMHLVLERIRSDSHHRAMRVQFDEFVTRRLFERWSMAYVQREDLSEELGRLHSTEGTLAERAAMLDELVRAGQDFLPDF